MGTPAVGVRLRGWRGADSAAANGHPPPDPYEMLNPGTPYRDANHIMQYISRPGSGWRQVTSMQEASDLANQGRVVVGGLQEPGHGHVIVVMPGPMQHPGGFEVGKNMLPYQKEWFPPAMSGFPYPDSILLDINGRKLAVIHEEFPYDAMNDLQIIFSHWHNDFPWLIEVTRFGTPPYGDFKNPPFHWTQSKIALSKTLPA